MLDYEYRFYLAGYQFIVGTDEAGRGPLAGPLVAAAVILPSHWRSELIADSKQLSEKKRLEAFAQIKEIALDIGIGIISPEEVDELNVYRASQKAMQMAIDQLKHHYDLIISDAMPLPKSKKPVEVLIKADQKSLSVAAASIIAKVTRDQIMVELDREYPQYDFKNNKGYCTKKHLNALLLHGPKRGIHRFSYKPVKKVQYEQLTLF
ncbi:MAG: ribonuclease HII [Bacilli bacterium]|jgi:ribonuclease HII